MSIFNKIFEGSKRKGIFKKKGDYSVLTDNYVPASRPTYGQGLENFVTADYPMNNPEIIETGYHEVEEYLSGVIATCDSHSTGSECDPYIDAKMDHVIAGHEAAAANNENQIVRIRSARTMRKEALDRKINPREEKIAKLQSEIEPLEELRSHFQIHIGKSAISIGLPITVIAMLVDAAVNYSFLQTVLLSNATLLLITVICMSVMSDGSMWALGTFLSRRKEKFTSKPLFWIICVGLASMFLLSVAASVMIRWGSMDATYGTINAAGEFVGKESYSLAEYGVTLATAFVTTATGLLSFAFSLDENAFLVSIRERKKKELARCLAEIDPLLNERALLENAPDPKEWDERKRAAAERQIEAVRLGLKLHCRKLMAEGVNDPDFTERMTESGEALLRKGTSSDISKMPATTIIKKAA